MAYPLPPAVAQLERRLGVPEGSLDDVDLARAEDALEDAATLALAEVSQNLADRWELDAPAALSRSSSAAFRPGHGADERPKPSIAASLADART